MSDPVTPLSPEQTQQAEMDAENEPYPVRVAEALDVDLNVDTGGLQDETLSARFARWAYTKKGVRGAVGRFMCRALNIAQKDHGAHAVAGAVGHAEKVIEAEQASGLIDASK